MTVTVIIYAKKMVMHKRVKRLIKNVVSFNNAKTQN